MELILSVITQCASFHVELVEFRLHDFHVAPQQMSRDYVCKHCKCRVMCPYNNNDILDMLLSSADCEILSAICVRLVKLKLHSFNVLSVSDKNNIQTS